MYTPDQLTGYLATILSDAHNSHELTCHANPIHIRDRNEAIISLSDSVPQVLVSVERLLIFEKPNSQITPPEASKV